MKFQVRDRVVSLVNFTGLADRSAVKIAEKFGISSEILFSGTERSRTHKKVLCCNVFLRCIYKRIITYIYIKVIKIT